MALTNAERQAVWRVRNVVALTARSQDIAEKLIGAIDRKGLRRIVTAINNHLATTDRRRPRRLTDEECISEAAFQAEIDAAIAAAEACAGGNNG